MSAQAGYTGLIKSSWGYFRRRGNLSAPPVQVSIEPTNICNFRCAFCPQSLPGHEAVPRGRMSLELCRNLLERLAEQFYPEPAARKVSFTHDGEPFVNPDFPAMLVAASELSYQIKFASNGSLAAPDVIDPLVESGVRFNICVDFCADSETFEKIRGPAGSYRRVLENLRHLAYLARVTGAVSLDICDITGFTTFDPGRRKSNLAALQDLFESHKSKRVRFYSRVFHNMTGKIQVPGNAKKRGRYRVCPYPWFDMNIAWDGRVVVCCRDLRGETVLGNAFETDSLWEIWNGESYRRLRAGLSVGDISQFRACAGCDLPWDNTRWSPAYLAHSAGSRLLRLGRK